MSHNSWFIWPLILIYNFWIILLAPTWTLFLYILSVRNHDSWVITLESSYLYFLAKDTTLYKGMNHDSCLMSHPTSNTDSQLLNHIAHPSFTPFHNLRYSKKPWIMIHDSWVIPPLILTHNSWIILFTPLLLHFTIYTAVRSHESWVMTPESSYL